MSGYAISTSGTLQSPPGGSRRLGPPRSEPAGAARPDTQVLRVVLQERRQLLRLGLGSLLDAEPDLAVVASAATGPELLAASATLRPAVAVVELHAEDWDVPSLVADLRTAGVERVAALHEGRRADVLRQAHRADVDVLVPYGTGERSLLAGVRGLEHLDERPPAERRSLPSRHVLTAREREVVAHIAAGLTTTESAALLEISPKTVDNHKQRIFSKLGVQNQAHAVALAHRIGILAAQPARTA